MQVAFPFIPYVPYEITMAIMRDQYILYKFFDFMFYLQLYDFSNNVFLKYANGRS